MQWVRRRRRAVWERYLSSPKARNSIPPEESSRSQNRTKSCWRARKRSQKMEPGCILPKSLQYSTSVNRNSVEKEVRRDWQKETKGDWIGLFLSSFSQVILPKCVKSACSYRGKEIVHTKQIILPWSTVWMLPNYVRGNWQWPWRVWALYLLFFSSSAHCLTCQMTKTKAASLPLFSPKHLNTKLVSDQHI